MMRFQSAASGDVQMFSSDAAEMLKALGRTGPKGALLAEDLAASIAKLEAAVTQHQQLAAAVPPAKPQHNNDEEVEQRVDFSRRAWPLLELLRLSAQQQATVTWGL